MRIEAMTTARAARVLSIYQAGIDEGNATFETSAPTWEEYVDPAARGRGIGPGLLDALIASTEAAGIGTIQSGAFPENHASITLHTPAGFRIVGTRERIGAHHGRWRDVVLIERRSQNL
jgi:L-amino acid N-acyltransferase YncA